MYKMKIKSLEINNKKKEETKERKKG